jgi:hypothetical protein
MEKTRITGRWTFPAFILAFALACLGLVASGQAQAPAAEDATYLELWKTIQVEGEPQAIVVSCAGPDCSREHDAIVFDSSDDTVRFIDGDTGSLAPDQINLLHNQFDSFMEYDRYHRQAYIVGDDEACDDWGYNCWRRMWLHIIGGRERLNSIVINEEHQDYRYDVDGLTMKQPFEEGSGNARIIVDNTIHGNIDVVDLDGQGKDAALLQRYSYRAPVACADEPTCNWRINEGNSLALETQHETLPVDDLVGRDILYIGDDNGILGHIRAIRIGHPGSSLLATPLPDIDFSGVYPCNIGVRGLSMAGPRDILYMPSGCQSFEYGSVGEFSTITDAANTVTIPYRDQNFVHVDWYDPKRVFVATSDAFCRGDSPYDASCGLYLHLIYDGTLVDSLALMADYSQGSLKDMAFDPYKRLLFLTVDAPPLSSVMIVRVNYGAGAAPVEPAVGSDLITPEQGGAFSASDRSAELFFSAGVVDDPVLVGYREGHPTVSSQHDVPPSVSAANGLLPVRDFQVSAVISDTSTPVNEFNSFYRIDIHYTEKEIAGAVESTLALYRWDGGHWQLEPSGTLVASSNVLTAYPTRPGLFAVMGETLRSYLPVVIR